MAAELEPPLAEIIKRRHGTMFETVRRGYVPSQVDVFLVSVATGIDAREQELRELRSPVGHAAQKYGTDEASDSSKRLARLVEVGEREVEQMREEANAEAAKIRSDARREAGRVTREARDEATQAVDEVQAFLDQVDEDTRRIPAEAEQRRRQMIEETRAMQERLMKIAKALDSVLDAKGTSTLPRDANLPAS
jgi:cell division septum initiation protein DivIVA